MPYFIQNWSSLQPKPLIFMVLDQNPAIWGLVAYILPCDVLSLVMLYLMRAAPRAPLDQSEMKMTAQSPGQRTADAIVLPLLNNSVDMHQENWQNDK